MRVVALTAALAWVLVGCSDASHGDKAAGAGAQGPGSPASTEPSAGEPRPRALGYGHPPQTFATADTNGRVLAATTDRIFWVERRGSGDYVVGAPKDGKPGRERFEVAGPLPPVTDLAARDGRVYIATSTVTARPGDELLRGVLMVMSDAKAPPVRLSPETGALAAYEGGVYVLRRGTHDQAGTIEALSTGASRTRRVLIQRPGGFGRADLRVERGQLVWLGDERREIDGVPRRTAFVQVLAPGTTRPGEVTSGADSPGPYLHVRGDFVYFTARDQERRRLFRAPLAGGAATPLFDPRWEVRRFTVDDTGVYAYARQSTWKIVHFDLDSGDAQVLSSPKRPVTSDLFVDATHVYWGTSGAILRVAKALPPSTKQSATPPRSSITKNDKEASSP